MNLSGLEDLIPDVAAFLHVTPATALLLLGFVVSLCNLTGRLIPDEATGWKGLVRKVCKLVGLYASNRVASGVSVNDVTKVLIESKLPIRDDSGKFTSQTVVDAARDIK